MVYFIIVVVIMLDQETTDAQTQHKMVSSPEVYAVSINIQHKESE